jgi:hypothetical protein
MMQLANQILKLNAEFAGEEELYAAVSLKFMKLIIFNLLIFYSPSNVPTRGILFAILLKFFTDVAVGYIVIVFRLFFEDPNPHFYIYFPWVTLSEQFPDPRRIRTVGSSHFHLPLAQTVLRLLLSHEVHGHHFIYHSRIEAWILLYFYNQLLPFPY